MSEDQYHLLTLTDGQQVLAVQNGFIHVDVGIVTPDGLIEVDRSEPFTATKQEYHDLLGEAMTKTIQVDTITGKALATMNTDTPIDAPGNPVTDSSSPSKDVADV